MMFRWGQAAALVGDMMWVQGGMTGNSNGYTSGPTTSELLLLPLNASFLVSSPPWQSINPSSGSEPSVAWHSLNPVNTSDLLLFGGIPGYNTNNTPLPTQADSAWIVNISDSSSPSFTQEPTNWASEPVRRFRHTATSSSTGQIYIIGGEKVDGSGLISDHFIFNPNASSFTQLNAQGGPGMITGHQSIMLTNGTLLVFGGASSTTTLNPLSTMWSLDTTQSTLTWKTVPVSGDPPPSRRQFAAAYIPPTEIIIHGGTDASFQEPFSDGWIFDVTNTNWTNITQLSQLGPRRDHSVEVVGSQLLFSFGMLIFHHALFQINLIIL
jgi:hypothetical protein